MPKPARTVSTYLILALILASTLAVLPLSVPIAKAQAPSITIPDKYFNPEKAIMVEVRGDFGPEIMVRITDDVTGALLAEELVPRVVTGYYVFYLGGPNSWVEYPVGGAPTITVDTAKGRPIRVEVLGTGLFDIVYYDVKLPTAPLDRKEYPYRRDAMIRISYTDPDADYDPTLRDTLPASCVLVDITLIKADGKTFIKSTNLADLGAADSPEPTVRGGKFSYAIKLSAISTAVGVDVSKDDKVLLSFRTSADCQGGAGWVDPKYTVDFKAVYRYPTIAVSFDQQRIVIDVTSPDDNVDSTIKDNLDPGATITLTVAGMSTTISYTSFIETGPDTNVFRHTLSVTWGTALSVTPTLVTLPRNTDGPFTATISYYKSDPRPGYSIDASGSGTYTPKLPTIVVDKASVKVIIATITKPDLNNLPGSIEILSGTSIETAGKFDIRLDKDGVYLARLRILDKTGALVSLKPGFSPTDVTMVETDFNTGVFTLRIPAELVGILAGETYTLEYTDFAGFKGAKVTVTFKVEEIKLTIDRGEYPAALGSTITVYVDYSNDLYNKDPTLKESKAVAYRIVGFDGIILAAGTITLSETDVNTGLFRGKATVLVPADDRAIGGKLVVEDPDRPEAKAEAVLKVYIGELTITPKPVKMGAVITITVKDLDRDVDSKSKDSITVTVRSGKCPSFSVTLTETGPNTGEFRGTVRWDRTTGAIATCAVAPDTITVEYTDLRARELITGYASYTTTLRDSVTLASTTGELRAETVEPGKVSITEKFCIAVADWDLNYKYNAKDDATAYVAVEGIHVISPIGVSLTETAENTGLFKLCLWLSDIPGVPVPLKDLAKLIGKKVFLMYVDEADATGARAVVRAELTITAYDPELKLTPKPAVNLGDVLTVTVVDKNRVGAGTVKVTVKSTIYPIPIEYDAREVEEAGKPTGVFVVKIRVIDIKDWYPGYPEPSVPARFGDTVDVIYVAPVNSKGETDVIYSDSVVVGIRPVIPAETKKVEFLDERGVAITPRVGILTFITVTVANVDIVTHSMTVMVVVRDPKGVAVALYFASVTLPPGASQQVGFGWTPIVSGKHTIEVYVVKSLADRTPLATPTTATVDVAK